MAISRSLLLALAASVIAPSMGSAGLRRAAAPAPAAAPSGPSDEEILKGKMELDGPEQGFMGENVKHENTATYTADFGTEYGPDAKHFVDRWPREPIYPRSERSPFAISKMN